MKTPKYTFLVLVVINFLVLASLLYVLVLIQKPSVIPLKQIRSKVLSSQTIEELRGRTLCLADAYYALDDATTTLIEIVQYLLLVVAGLSVFNICMARQIMKEFRIHRGDPQNNIP